MTRHAKNCTAGTVYTYHERKKDTKKSGYGSKSVRLGRDSVKNFDCCCLTLQPCREPVVTPDGFLYDREAILECLLHQKTEAARKMKAFEKQKKKQDAEEAGKVEEKEKSKVESFVNMEKRLTTKPTSAFTASKDRSVNGSSAVADEQQPSTSSGKKIESLGRSFFFFLHFLLKVAQVAQVAMIKIFKVSFLHIHGNRIFVHISVALRSLSVNSIPQNDHQLKKLLIVKQILLINTLGNTLRSVGRLCIQMLECKGLSGKP